LAASVIAGIGNGIFIVAARTAVQEAVEEQWMAVMMSFNESLGQLVPGLGILLGGLLATLEGPRTALGVGGIGALVLTAGAWFVLRPSPRPRRAHIERPAHDQA
jgi:MFS family permease